MVLAAGEGSRIKHLLEADEPLKALIKVGEKRLIYLVLDSLEGINVERAVLSYPSSEYKELDKRVQESNVRVVKQWLPHLKLPYILELPLILLTQYHFSKDRNYLQSFDSVMTMQCDKVLEGVNLGEMLRFHYHELQNPNDRQVTLLSRQGIYAYCKAELFKMEGDRIIGRKGYKENPVNGYEITSQAGTFVFSRGMLKNPLWVLFGLRYNKILRYLAEGTWIDYGHPENLQRLRT